MRTDDLIVHLAGSAGPVRPLAPPLARLVRWSAGALAATVAGVALLGPRPDASTMASQIEFLAMAALTLATSLISAGAALILAVPGAERSAAQRWAPLVAAVSWAALLTTSLVSGGSVPERLAAFPFHLGCVMQIAALAIAPGWGLVAMVRRAAPLRLRWSGGLAALAALALGAAGTQFTCPLNDPAHLLVGHLLPVALLALTGAVIGRRALAWPHPRLTPAASR